MKRSIDIMLEDGRKVGMLRHDLQGRRENAAFEYDSGWLGDRDRFALGPTLPTKVGQQFRREDKEEQALPLNALDCLLAVDDASRIGALRYRDEGGVFRRAPEEGRRTAPPLAVCVRNARSSTRMGRYPSANFQASRMSGRSPRERSSP